MGERVRFDGVSTAYRAKGRRGWRRRGERTTALEGIDFGVEAGEILGVIGRNGSGKSTLLLTAAGVLRPRSGRVHVDAPVAPFIHLSLGFHRELSGRENLLITSVLLGSSRAEARARYPEIARFTELDEQVLDAPLLTYSAGMIVRLGFALISHGNPSVLLVDEVLAAADESFRRKAIGRIRELVSNGAGAIVVSHDLDLIAETCDRVMVLEAGRTRFVGSASEAVRTYQHTSR